jgi:hypothetical protein
MAWHTEDLHRQHRTPFYLSDQGESRTPKPFRARRSERRVSASCTTWPAEGGFFERRLGTAFSLLAVIDVVVAFEA